MQKWTQESAPCIMAPRFHVSAPWITAPRSLAVPSVASAWPLAWQNVAKKKIPRRRRSRRRARRHRSRRRPFESKTSRGSRFPFSLPPFPSSSLLPDAASPCSPSRRPCLSFPCFPSRRAIPGRAHALLRCSLGSDALLPRRPTRCCPRPRAVRASGLSAPDAPQGPRAVRARRAAVRALVPGPCAVRASGRAAGRAPFPVWWPVAGLGLGGGSGRRGSPAAGVGRQRCLPGTFAAR